MDIWTRYELASLDAKYLLMLFDIPRDPLMIRNLVGFAPAPVPIIVERSRSRSLVHSVDVPQNDEPILRSSSGHGQPMLVLHKAQILRHHEIEKHERRLTTLVPVDRPGKDVVDRQLRSSLLKTSECRLLHLELGLVRRSDSNIVAECTLLEKSDDRRHGDSRGMQVVCRGTSFA